MLSTRSYIAGGIGFLLVSALGLGLAEKAPLKDRPPHSTTAMSAVSPRREIVMIFVASSNCGATKTPGLAQALRDLPRRLEPMARADGRVFSTIGVSLDWNASVGFDLLKQFGEFDEVSSGMNWHNTSVQKFLPDRRVVPQLIILERRTTLDSVTRAVDSEVVLLRRAGSREILDWIRGDSLRAVLAPQTPTA